MARIFKARFVTTYRIRRCPWTQKGTFPISSWRPQSARHEDPLLENLRQPDNILRFRIISSLNKLHTIYPDMQLDATTVETVLASEIMSHYRAYQIIGRVDGHRAAGILRSPSPEILCTMNSNGFSACSRCSIPNMICKARSSALESGNGAHRDSALEFIDNTLKPSIRRLLVPWWMVK